MIGWPGPEGCTLWHLAGLGGRSYSGRLPYWSTSSVGPKVMRPAGSGAPHSLGGRGSKQSRAVLKGQTGTDGGLLPSKLWQCSGDRVDAVSVLVGFGRLVRQETREAKKKGV